MKLAKKSAGEAIAVLELWGSMQMGSDCRSLTQAVDELVALNERRVILDLAPLELIDSAAVGTIVSCYSHLRKLGGTLRLAGPRGMVETVLKLTQVQRAIEFFPSVREAAENFPPLAEAPPPRP